jgi:metallo-beta-lactamase family protein
MQISFLGATGTVTGSKYLFEDGHASTLIDCGLFQGFKQLRLRNWQPPPLDPKQLASVVLTHAHIDHSGYLPLLVKNGFAGRVYCSKATRDLCEILLPDAAHLQEEEARYANKRGFSKHRPALPLFTIEDAERALRHLHAVEFDEAIALSESSSARLLPAGHILGASMIMIESAGRKVLFSGDLGRPNDLMMVAPTLVTDADALVLESTYGNRRHSPADPEEELGTHLSRALGRGGVVVIPAFAVGRAQWLLHLVARLKSRGKLAGVPIYLNSPMAVDATRIYHNYRSQHRLSVEECTAACRVAEFVNSPEASKELNAKLGPMVIIAASGMATGGRVVHHLRAFAPNPKRFSGGGNAGGKMLGGAETVRIHGSEIPIHAEVANLETLSGHADYVEILDWRLPGGADVSPMDAIDRYFVEVTRANPGLRPRVGNPDELQSNHMGETLKALKHRVNRPEPGVPEAVDGCIITALNEEAVIGAALGNKGGINIAVSYEAFAVKMLGALRQDIIFARQQREIGRPPGWLGVPLIVTSHVWENGKNELSHQDPTIGEALLGEMSDVARVLFPADANTAVEALRSVYAGHGQIACLIVPKRTVVDVFDAVQSRALVSEGAIALSGDASRSAIQLVAIGAYQLREALRAHRRLEECGCRALLTYMLEPARFREPRDPLEQAFVAGDDALRSLFPAELPRVFATHTRPEPIVGLLRRLETGQRTSRSAWFRNRGGTLDVAGMLFTNRCTWAHLVDASADLLGRQPREMLDHAELAALSGRGDPRAVV